MKTVASTLPDVEARLGRAGVEKAGVDAEILVAHALGITRSALALSGGRELSVMDAALLETLVARRARREPLQYVSGEWGFRRLTLRVDRRALIPRPETEAVVERVLARIAGHGAPAVLDVGVGSGAIALAVADEHPGARVVGIDASADALALARENAARCGLAVELTERDVATGLPDGPWDVVVSNPPYIPVADRDALAPEVRDWEPAAALYENGATEAIAHDARRVLAEEGALVLEVADDSAGVVATRLRELGYRDVQTTPDLSDRDRVVEATR